MKSMKKSMFVTTILMVVLLIVALSTATFAWYTANTNVGATRTTVTSASSSTASLIIDNKKNNDPNATRSSVDLSLTGTNVPMVYTTNTQVTTNTTYGAFIDNFYTFTVDNAERIVGGSVKNVAPAVLDSVTGSAVSSSEIVLTNNGGAAMSSISTTVTIEGFYTYDVFPTTASVTDISGKYTYDAGVYTLHDSGTAENATVYYTRSDLKDYLRVAVFSCAYEAVTEEEGHTLADELKLKGIYGAGTAQRAAETLIGAANGSLISGEGNVIGSNTLNTDLTALKSSGSALPISGTVSASNAIYVKVVVWFEGVSMHNIDASKTAAFTMTFSATQAA